MYGKWIIIFGTEIWIANCQFEENEDYLKTFAMITMLSYDIYAKKQLVEKLIDSLMEVAEQTGASTATISRVNRSLNYGKDGYEMVMIFMPKNSLLKNSLTPYSLLLLQKQN